MKYKLLTLMLAAGLSTTAVAATAHTYEMAKVPEAIKLWAKPAYNNTLTFNVAVPRGYYNPAMIHRALRLAVPSSTRNLVIGIGGNCFNISFLKKKVLYAVDLCEVGVAMSPPMPPPSTGDSRYSTLQ